MTDQKDSKLPVLYRSLQGHNDPIESICFNTNSQQMASASGDSLLYLWNLQSSNIQAKKLKGHSAAITEVVPDDLGRLQSIWAAHSHCVHGPHNPSMEQQQRRKLSFNGHPLARCMRQDSILLSGFSVARFRFRRQIREALQRTIA